MSGEVDTQDELGEVVGCIAELSETDKEPVDYRGENFLGLGDRITIKLLKQLDAKTVGQGCQTLCTGGRNFCVGATPTLIKEHPPPPRG